MLKKTWVPNSIKKSPQKKTTITNIVGLNISQVSKVSKVDFDFNFRKHLEETKDVYKSAVKK